MTDLRARLERAAPWGVGLLAAFVLLPRLAEPGRIYFDETYYVNDARQYLALGVEDSFAVHPPVGKWLIAAGIRVFGDNPAAWRLPGAVLGVATILLVFLIGRRLLGSVAAATAASLLLLADGMFLSQARIAMLDIHLVFFVVLGVEFLLRDRAARADDQGRAPPWWRRGWLVGCGVAMGLATGTKWSGLFALGAVGLLFLTGEIARRRAPRARATTDTLPAGSTPPDDAASTSTHAAASVATVTDAAVAIGAGVDAATTADHAAPASGLEEEAPTNDDAPEDDTATGEPATARRSWWTGALDSVAPAAYALVMVPALVYLLTWVPWLVHFRETTEFPKVCPAAQEDPSPDAAPIETCPTDLRTRLDGLIGHHEAIYTFHTTLESDHSYLAPATTWPVLGRPVVYYYEDCSEDRASGVETTDSEGVVTTPEPCEVPVGDAAEIIALGNPALWWGHLLALVGLLVAAGRGDPRAAIPLSLWGVQYAPWLLSPRPSFFFYTAPLVPFMALGLVAALVIARERATARLARGGDALWPVAVGAVGASLGFLVGLVARDEELGFAVAIGAAILTTVLASRYQPTERPEPAWWQNSGTVLGVGLGVFALTLFVYFLPVWMAMPMVKDAVRERWWFSSWI